MPSGSTAPRIGDCLSRDSPDTTDDLPGAARWRSRLGKALSVSSKPDLRSLVLDEIIERVTTIVVDKFARLSREESEAMLGLTKTILEETRVYCDPDEEEWQQGRQQGQASGVSRDSAVAAAGGFEFSVGITQ